MTVNQAIIEDKYPLLRVEDLYASLACGSTFSKLDLSCAYMQLILDEEFGDWQDGTRWNKSTLKT